MAKLKRYAYPILIGLTVMTYGCQTTTHAEAKLQAHGRWNQMRGRVKQGLAEQQFEARLFEDAIVTITEAISLDPHQPDAYALLTRANLELGKPASAQTALDAARHAGIDSADLIYLHGVILEQRGYIQTAHARYTQARKLEPKNVDFLVAEVECLVALDRAPEAFELLEENADRLDDDGTVMALAAHVATQLGDVDGAIRWYRRALIAQSGRGQGWETRAVSTLSSRLPSDFSEDRINGTPATAGCRLIREELGRLLVDQRRCAEAVGVLTPLTHPEVDTDANGVTRRALATCHLLLGDPASARSVLLEYAGTHLDDTLAQLLLAKAAIATGDLVTALRAVDAVQQREPARPELWLVRATVNWSRGRFTAAASDLHDVLQNDPDDVDAHCLLAEVLRAQKRVDAARTHFQRALKIEPDCAWAAAGLESLRKVLPTPEPASPKLTSAESEAVPADSR